MYSLGGGGVHVCHIAIYQITDMRALCIRNVYEQKKRQKVLTKAFSEIAHDC